jgi:hypothetical protein
MAKKPRRTPRKPTGTLGGVVFGGGRTAEFKEVQFPENKREIESQIFNEALKASASVSPNFWEFYGLTAAPIQNRDEDGFDYILHTKTGEQYLDLAEAAPLAKLGGTYDAVGLSYRNGERADVVYDVIAGKVAKYGVKPRSPIHLLLYTTDFRLSLDSGVLDIVGYRASRQPHSFRSIVYFEPPRDLQVVYPRLPEDFDGFEEGSSRQMQTVIGDLSTARPIPNGVALKLPFFEPLGPGPVTFIIDAEQEPD